MSALLKKTIYYGYVVVNTKLTNAKREVIGEKPIEEHIVWDDIPPIITKSQWNKFRRKHKVEHGAQGDALSMLTLSCFKGC